MREFAIASLRFGALAILGLVMNCGAASDAGTCTPGQSVVCACASGQRGAQTCTADHGFDPCLCQTNDGQSQDAAAPNNAPDAAAMPTGPVPAAAPQDGGAGAAASAIKSLCDEVFVALDRKVDDCCGAETDRSYFEGSYVRDTRRALAAECEGVLRASIEKSRIEINISRAATCAAAARQKLSTLSCGADELRGLTTVWSQDICLDVIVGLQTDEQPCVHSFECGHNLSCVGYGPDHDGICRAIPIREGLCGPIAGPEAVTRFPFEAPDCGQDLTCGLSVGQKVYTCNVDVSSPRHTVPSGQPCSATSDCAWGLFCPDRSDTDLPPSQQGRCTPLKAAGAFCSYGGKCRGYCADAQGLPKAETGGTPTLTCRSVCGSN